MPMALDPTHPAASRPPRAARRDDLIGGLRVIVRSRDDADNPAHATRIDKHVQSFLEAQWTPAPRRHLRLTNLGYALMDAVGEDALAAALQDIAQRMSVFLFGADENVSADILTLAGPAAVVAEFLHGDEAHARACLLKYDNAHEAGAHGDAPALEESEPDSPARFGFQAIFDVRHEAILASMACPLRTPQADASLSPEDASAHWEMSLPTVHTALLDYALEGLRTMEATAAPLIYCPVEYSALATPHRLGDFMALCAEAPERTLGVKIVNAPNFPPSDRVRGITHALAGRFRFIDWEVAPGELDPAWYLGSGLHSVTLAAPENTTDRHAAILRFLKAIPELRQQRIRTGVRGALEAADVAACADARVDFLCGPSVATVSSAPFTPQRVPATALPLSA